MKHGNSQTGKLPIFRERLLSLQGDLSIKDFAEKLGLTRQTVGFYLNGDRIPDALTLSKISKKLSVSSDYLIGLSNDPRLNPSAVDDLSLSVYSISWLERLKSYSDRDPLHKQMINTIFEDIDFQKTVFNLTNYLESLHVENRAFKQYMKYVDYGPGREEEARASYALDILKLSQDAELSERERRLFEAEYERFTFGDGALWDVLSGDDEGFHFSKIFAYRANNFFAVLLDKFERQSKQNREEYVNELLASDINE